MGRHPQQDLDVQLCFPLYAATRAVTRTYARLLTEVGLTYPQYLTMLALWSAPGPLTVGALGERLRLDSGTLTPLLKRLEAMGYVERRRDLQDERRVLVSVTEQGQALSDAVADVPLALGKAMSLSRGEAGELRRLLLELISKLDDAERDSAVSRR